MKFRPHTKIKAPNGQGDPNQTDKNPLSAGVLGSYYLRSNVDITTGEITLERVG